MTDLVATIKAEMKAAMKARDKPRLGTIRLIQAEFKRIEVDERIDIDDARALTILDKMVKQRRDSIEAYTKGGRADLAQQEAEEIACIENFLPEQLSSDEMSAAIDRAIEEKEADCIKDMGKVMGFLKENYAGRMDFSKVSGAVKDRLGAC